MRVIVAGGREVKDPQLVADAIEASGFEITELVHGAARGVDSLAEAWAKSRRIPITRFPAQWTLYGRSAGPRRNLEMANYANALIAIPTGGPGTRNMIETARRQGLKVSIYLIDICGDCGKGFCNGDCDEVDAADVQHG